MKQAPLYSRSRQRSGQQARTSGTGRGRAPLTATPSPPAPSGADAAAADIAADAAGLVRRRRWGGRRMATLWMLAAVALLMAGGLIGQALHPAAPVPTSREIISMVRRSIVKQPLPSPWSGAYAAIAPSVVRVVGLDDEKTPPPKAGEDPHGHARSTGTGVVIVDNGTILTNLHVVVGSRHIRVTFFDGLETDATMVGAQPENDLAVLRAKSVPDDLVPATLRGTGDLMPGDEVLAVGFPFGIGPSASGGVVSGLRRSFRSPDGERLRNLIQFDAAANPGNSGGPLVTMSGEVVGIVTAILNPGDQGTFIGIGFAVPIENAAAAVGLPPF